MEKEDRNPKKAPDECLTWPITTVPKNWGGEEFLYHKDQELNFQQIQVDTVKLLHVGQGKKCSQHYHALKQEFFICITGIFHIKTWDTQTYEERSLFLYKGQRIFIPRGVIHQIIGIDKENTLLEVSTLDTPEDSYRIKKGD